MCVGLNRIVKHPRLPRFPRPGVLASGYLFSFIFCALKPSIFAFLFCEIMHFNLFISNTWSISGLKSSRDLCHFEIRGTSSLGYEIFLNFPGRKWTFYLTPRGCPIFRLTNKLLGRHPGVARYLGSPTNLQVVIPGSPMDLQVVILGSPLDFQVSILGSSM